MIFQAAQLLISLLAILLVGWIVSRLGLGSDVRLSGEDHARELAAAAHCGFVPEAVALDRTGIGALVRSTDGRLLLLRRHGAHFAARLLDSHAHTRLDRNFLLIGTAEKQFGGITLDLGPQAQIWASSLRQLKG